MLPRAAGLVRDTRAFVDARFSFREPRRFIGIGLDCRQQANNNGSTLAANFQMKGTTRIKMIDEILIFTAKSVRLLHVVEHSFDLF